MTSVEKFKEAIVNPLKKTIAQNKAVSISQFRSRDDLKKHWDVAEGMEIVLNHVESVYTSMSASPSDSETVHDIEIIPPQ
jgi:hypothetical protein